MTLKDEIRDHIDTVAPPITLDEIVAADNAQVRTTQVDIVTAEHSARRGHRRRWTPSLLVGAAALVLGVLTIGATDLFGQRDLVETTDTPAIDLVPGAWEQLPDREGLFVPSDVVETIEIPGGGSQTGISSIAVSGLTATDDGYVAVGSESVGFVEVAAVWSTNDGETWTRIGAGSPAFGELGVEVGDIGPTGFSMSDVAAAGERIVAVGRQNADTVAPTAWTASTLDGNWERVALPIEEPGFFSGLRVASTSEGFVAVANHNRDFDTGRGNRTLVWVSPDGLEWIPVTDAGFADGEAISAIETHGDRIVAVGTSDGFNKPRAAAWISDDAGQTWTRAILPDAPDDRPVTSMVDVAVGSEGLVAVGHQAISGDTSWGQRDGGSRTLSDQQDIIVWSSPDGIEWKQSGEVRAPNQITIDPSITAGPGGYLISFTTLTPETIETSTWLTTGGATFEEINEPGDYVHSVTASFEDSYVSIAKSHPYRVAPSESESQPAKPLQIWKLPFN